MVNIEASNVLPVKEHKGQGLSLDFLFSNPTITLLVTIRTSLTQLVESFNTHFIFMLLYTGY